MVFTKRLVGMAMGCAALLGSGSALANACLQQASNADLVNELSRRLYVGGGGGGVGAQANYGCDLYGDLRIGLLGPTGSETKVEVSVRNAQICSRQRDLLSQFKSRIHQVTMIGACDLYGDLQRFSLTTDGRIQKLSEVTIRNIDTCLKQADAMNRQ